jgi:hypothetical protein
MVRGRLCLVNRALQQRKLQRCNIVVRSATRAAQRPVAGAKAPAVAQVAQARRCAVRHGTRAYEVSVCSKLCLLRKNEREGLEEKKRILLHKPCSGSDHELPFLFAAVAPAYCVHHNTARSPSRSLQFNEGTTRRSYRAW